MTFTARSNSEIRSVVLNSAGILFAALAVWNLFVVLFGYSLGVILLLHVPVNGALGFIGLKQGGLLQNVVKSA